MRLDGTGICLNSREIENMLSFNARKLPVIAPAKTDFVLLCQRISN